MYKYEQCKLCFYRGGENCYEQSYVDGKFNSIQFTKADAQFLIGCKKMREAKIKKLIGNK